MSKEEIARDLPGKPPRFAELDSLRGLAALTVIFGHFSKVYLNSRPFAFLGKFPVRVLLNGHAAVILFFLLSGFVLSLPYRLRGIQYGSFLTRRVCRIYLPYLAALALALLGDWWLHGPIQGNGMGWDKTWMSATWTNPPNARLILEHVLFLGDYDSAQYNTAFWSLVYEMRISLIFPFVAVAILRMRARWAFLGAVILSLATQPLATLFAPAFAANPDPTVTPGLFIFMTLHFLAFFMLGAMLAKNLEQATSWYARLPRAGRVALWISSVFLFDGQFVRHLPRFLHFMGGLFFPGQGQDWLTAAGGLLIILFGLQSAPIKRLLHHAVVHHVGRTSYSLYLVHGTVLFTMVHLWPTLSSIWLALLIYVVAVSLLTEGFYHLVEKPSMELGQRLAPRKRLAPIATATVST